MTKQTLTHSRLIYLLSYNADTGVFTWNDTEHRVIAGSVAGFTHNVKGYRFITIDGVWYREHRLAFLYMTGEFPPDQVDHINHIRHDNRWVNLRLCSNKENHKNQKLSKSNKSGVYGVQFVTKTGRWRSFITIQRKNIHLYSGYDLFQACCARKSAENKYGYHKNHGSIVAGD